MSYLKREWRQTDSGCAQINLNPGFWHALVNTHLIQLCNIEEKKYLSQPQNPTLPAVKISQYRHYVFCH